MSKSDESGSHGSEWTRYTAKVSSFNEPHPVALLFKRYQNISISTDSSAVSGPIGGHILNTSHANTPNHPALNNNINNNNNNHHHHHHHYSPSSIDSPRGFVTANPSTTSLLSLNTYPTSPIMAMFGGSDHDMVWKQRYLDLLEMVLLMRGTPTTPPSSTSSTTTTTNSMLPAGSLTPEIITLLDQLGAELLKQKTEGEATTVLNRSSSSSSSSSSTTTKAQLPTLTEDPSSSSPPPPPPTSPPFSPSDNSLTSLSSAIHAYLVESSPVLHNATSMQLSNPHHNHHGVIIPPQQQPPQPQPMTIQPPQSPQGSVAPSTTTPRGPQRPPPPPPPSPSTTSTTSPTSRLQLQVRVDHGSDDDDDDDDRDSTSSMDHHPHLIPTTARAATHHHPLPKSFLTPTPTPIHSHTVPNITTTNLTATSTPSSPVSLVVSPDGLKPMGFNSESDLPLLPPTSPPSPISASSTSSSSSGSATESRGSGSSSSALAPPTSHFGTNFNYLHTTNKVQTPSSKNNHHNSFSQFGRLSTNSISEPDSARQSTIGELPPQFTAAGQSASLSSFGAFGGFAGGFPAFHSASGPGATSASSSSAATQASLSRQPSLSSFTNHLYSSGNSFNPNQSGGAGAFAAGGFSSPILSGGMTFNKATLASDYFLSQNPSYLPPPPLSYLLPLHSDSPPSRHVIHRNASLLLTQRKQIIAVFQKLKVALPLLNQLSTAFQTTSDALSSDECSDMVSSHLANPTAIYVYNLMNQHKLINETSDIFASNYHQAQNNFLNGSSNINPLNPFPTQQPQFDSFHHPGLSTPTSASRSLNAHPFGTPSKNPSQPQPPQLQPLQSPPMIATISSATATGIIPLPPQPTQPPQSASHASSPHQSTTGDINTTHDLFLLGNTFKLDTAFQSFGTVLSSCGDFFKQFSDNINLLNIAQELSTECATLQHLYTNYTDALRKYEEHQDGIIEKQEKWIKGNPEKYQLLLQQQQTRCIQNENSRGTGISSAGYSRFSTLGSFSTSTSTMGGLSIPQQQQHRLSTASKDGMGKDDGEKTKRRSFLSRLMKDGDGHGKESVVEEAGIYDYTVQDSFEPEVLQWLVSHYHQHHVNEYSKYYGTVNHQPQRDDEGYTVLNNERSVSRDHSINSVGSSNADISSTRGDRTTTISGGIPSTSTGSGTTTNPNNATTTSATAPNQLPTQSSVPGFTLQHDPTTTSPDLMEIVGFGSGGVVTVSMRQRPTAFSTAASGSVPASANTSNKLPTLPPPSPRSKVQSGDVRLATATTPTSTKGQDSVGVSSGRHQRFLFDQSNNDDAQSVNSVGSNGDNNNKIGHATSGGSVAPQPLSIGQRSTNGSISGGDHHGLYTSTSNLMFADGIQLDKGTGSSSMNAQTGHSLNHTSFLNFQTASCPSTFQLLMHPNYAIRAPPQSPQNQHASPQQQQNDPSDDLYSLELCLFPPPPPLNNHNPFQQLHLLYHHYVHVRTLLILYINYLLVSSRISIISNLNQFCYKLLENFFDLESAVSPQATFLFEHQHRLQEVYNAYQNYQESIWLLHNENVDQLQRAPFSHDHLHQSSIQTVIPTPNGFATVAPGSSNGAFDQEYLRYLLQEVVPVRTTIPTLLEAEKAVESKSETPEPTSFEGSLSFGGAGLLDFSSDKQQQQQLERVMTSLSMGFGSTAPSLNISHHEKLIQTQIDHKLTQANIPITDLNRQTLLHMFANPPPHLTSNLFNLPLDKQPSTSLLFAHPKIIISGWLWKQASNITKDWQKRYFILTPTSLVYLRDCACYKSQPNDEFSPRLIDGYRQDVSKLVNIKTKKHPNNNNPSKKPSTTTSETDDVELELYPATNNNVDFDDFEKFKQKGSKEKKKDDDESKFFCSCNIGVQCVSIALSSAKALNGNKLIKPKYCDTSLELISPQTRRSYILRAQTPAERDLWLQTLQKAIGEALMTTITTTSNKDREPSIPRPISARQRPTSGSRATPASPGTTLTQPGLETPSSESFLGPSASVSQLSPKPNQPPQFQLQQSSRSMSIATNSTIYTNTSAIIPTTQDTPKPNDDPTQPPSLPFICTIDFGPTQLQSSRNSSTKISQLNPLCADCDSPMPEWCSINNAVAVCIRCSAIHRSLGVTISKTRSLNLDDLGVGCEALLAVVGNRFFNSIYEGNQPLIQELGPKPSLDTTSHDDREQFIRFKYANRTFVSKEVLAEYSCMPLESANKSFWAIANNSLQTLIKLKAAGGCDLGYLFPSPVNVCIALDEEIEHIDLAIDVNVVLKDEVDDSVDPKTIIISKGQPTTLLHFAIVHGNVLIIEHMVLNALNLTVKDGLGRTPLDVAKLCKNDYSIGRLSRR